MDVCESKLELADPCRDPLETMSLGGKRKTWCFFLELRGCSLPGETAEVGDVNSKLEVVSQLLELLPGPPRLSQSYWIHITGSSSDNRDPSFPNGLPSETKER